MRKTLKTLIVSWALLCVAGPALLAQVVTSSIVGTAFDPSGAVVPGVKVTLTNENTRFTRATTTNSSGDYVFPELQPGVYDISATMTGFEQFQFNHIILQVGETGRANIHFRLGQAAQAVTVTAPQVLLSTQTSSLGQVINTHTIEDLPLNGRDFMQLATLGSGVVPSSTRTSDAAGIDRGLTALQISGSRADEVSYLIDGVETTSIQLGPPSILISPDAIREFTILKNNFDARYGQASEIISMVTKSGTNAFHGSGYEFLRNSSLDSANFFDNFFGENRPTSRTNLAALWADRF